MIAYLKGELVFKSDEYIILEVQKIGYKVFMSKTAIDKLEEGKEIKIFTYLRLREDDVSLFGFTTNEELHMFELLISVGGIGAKSAINILSNITPSAFALAVITNNVNTLKKLQGIGPKTAQRIILELKDKIKTIDFKENNNRTYAVCISSKKITQKENAYIKGKINKNTYYINVDSTKNLIEIHLNNLIEINNGMDQEVIENNVLLNKYV